MIVGGFFRFKVQSPNHLYNELFTCYIHRLMFVFGCCTFV